MSHHRIVAASIVDGGALRVPRDERNRHSKRGRRLCACCDAGERRRGDRLQTAWPDAYDIRPHSDGR